MDAHLPNLKFSLSNIKIDNASHAFSAAITVKPVYCVRGQFAAFLAFKAKNQRPIIILLFETLQFRFFMKFLWNQPVLSYSTHGSQKSAANQKNREKNNFSGSILKYF